MTTHDESDRESSRQPAWRRYLRMIRPDNPGDFDDELRDHFESSIAALVREGMTPEAARAEATRRFGDVHRVREHVTRIDALHQSRTSRAGVVETFMYDVRHGVRGLARNPVFTVVATASIALGIAANATVFSVVNAVLLRPIPGAHADGLRRMYSNHHSPFEWSELSWFRERARTLDHVVGERHGVMAFRPFTGGEPERIGASWVTSGFFAALGVRPALGQLFDVDETRGAGSDPVVAITHAFWQRRFGGDSSVIGRKVILGDRPFTITAVTEPGFRGSVNVWNPEIFVPFAMAPVLTGQRLTDFGGSFYATVRLREGVPERAAAVELRELMRQLARTDSARYEGRSVRLDHTLGVNAELRGSVAAGSVFLMLMVAMVLLIACANVANLMLGRAAARRTEMGVRMAIGASRGRLIRQLLTESLIVAALGTAVGLALAWVTTRVLPAALPPEAGIDARFFAPDARVLLYTIVLCLATALLCGAVPSLRAASPDLIGILKGGGDASPARRRRGMLVAVQTGMCVLLLAVASYFMRGLASARGVDPGFDPAGIVDVNIDLGLLPASAGREGLLESIRRRAAQLPGVESATMAAVVPLSGSNMETRILPEGSTAMSRFDGRMVYFNIVAPAFFATLKTPVLRGREFLETDRDGARPVAIINETAARRLWPDGDALGRRFHWGDVDGPVFEIVGITRDANYVMPGEAPRVTVYLPLAQQTRSEMTLLLRTRADVATTRRAVWALVHEVATALPPPSVVAMSDDMAVTLLPVRTGAALLAAFGAIALIMATAGIYGVASYSVASRTREIGVRAALGATRPMLVGMVLAESARRVAVGAVVGIVATLGAGFGLSKVLYGVRPFDPLVLGGVIGAIAGIALLGTLGPARRAARADPVVAMRAE